MKPEKRRRDEPELNMEPAAELEQEEYSLDDILNEFGGWSQRPAAPPPEPEPPAEPEPEPPEDVKLREPEQPRPQETEKPDLSATQRFTPVSEPPVPEPEKPRIWRYEAEPAPESDERAERRRQAFDQRRRRKLERVRTSQERRHAGLQEQPEHSFASAREAYTYYNKNAFVTIRLLAVLILSITSGILLLLSTKVVFGLDRRSASGAMSVVMMILLLVQTILSYDVLAEGLLRLLRLQADQSTMLLVLVLISELDGVFAMQTGRVPFCAAVSLELTAAMWQKHLMYLGRRKTLKAACAMDEPFAAVREEKAWHGMDCIFRSGGDSAELARQLEMPDAGKRVMRVYAPVMLLVTLALSFLSAFRTQENFLWAWTPMLLAAFPTGMLLAFVRPLALHSQTLARAGVAVAGWQGARNLSGPCGIALEDADLFPAENMTLNGMKLYSDAPPSQIVGYAAAVVETAGSGMVPLFVEMMHAQSGRHYTVDTFRRYEGGGLGAEIQGDVILMGSHGFMKLMKVSMPDNARLKQAVYLSVNGALAAVFALTYAPADAVRGALAAAVRSSGLTPILATRDFMITPQLLHHRYKLPQDQLEFPTVEERAALSSPDAVQDGRQGALLARRSFPAFSLAVTTARAMRRTAISCMVISLLGGVLGAGLLFLMTFIGSGLAASAWNLFLYVILWFIPCWLMTQLCGRL